MKTAPVKWPERGAFTITELLVAAAISIIVVGAVVVVFRDIGLRIRIGRARLELAGQMRTVNVLIRDDLDRLTTPAVPWPEMSGAEGYLEIGESLNTITGDATLYPPPDNDNTFAISDRSLGDCNDYMAMTVHNPTQPYRGKIFGDLTYNPVTRQYTLVPGPNARTIESNTAEVVWFVSYTDNNGDGDWDGPAQGEPLKLIRRIFLVRPDIIITPGTVTVLGSQLDYDLSMRLEGGNLVCNTLADLGDRRNRAGRNPAMTGGGYAFAFPYTAVGISRLTFPPTHRRRGEDVVMTNLAAFDLRVYDPTLRVRRHGNFALLPEDPGYAAATQLAGTGAFVDLGRAGSHRFGPPVFGGLGFTYDTWTTLYENDGINQDGDAIIDEYTNNIDDDGVNGVDDDGERETSPPYPYRLRGVNVRVRTVEYDRMQVMQTSVSHSFVPE